MDTPWAVLLVKFNDNDSEPYRRDFYERLFTTAGSGRGNNMVDYFRDMSHGNLDLSGSQVFGWYTLNKSHSEYTGSGPNWQGRQQLVDWARQAATDEGADLTPFYGVVVCCNVPTDLFGGGGRQAVCDNGSMVPSLLGQEMGHGYGLNHSRADGSTMDYQDNWDIMSTMNAYVARDTTFRSIGPGLNAWNMRSQGWLDEGRVWRSTRECYDDVVELRPLHHYDLQGFLAAELGNEFLVEFRIREGWDGGIPRAAVVVHRFEDGHSYIMRGTRGQQNLVTGDKFAVGVLDHPFLPYTGVEVESVDIAQKTARLRLIHGPRHRPLYEGPWAQVFGSVPSDGGGFIVIGGHVVPVPPWDPMARILEHIAAYKSTTFIKENLTRDKIQRNALEGISDHVSKLYTEKTMIETPPLHSNLQGKTKKIKTVTQSIKKKETRLVKK